MTTYIYEPLDHSKAQIRLVTILRNLDESAPIHISLHTVMIPQSCLNSPLESTVQDIDLNSEDGYVEKPDFVALSYVWGSPDDPSEVLVDSAPEGANAISITRNLDAALRHIRCNSEEPAVFWIDALCIDQGNLDERSHQVTFMDSIYSICNLVIVWLGPEENNSDLAVGILLYVGQRIFVNADGMFERDPGAPPRQPEEPIWESLDDSNPIQIEEHDMCALVSLLKRPWFTRLWVRQEITLAREAIIQCGLAKIDWGYFRNAVGCLLRKRLNPLLPFDLCGRLVQVRPNIISISEANLVSYQYETLRGQNQGVSCTDPRDKIYGVGSLLTNQDKKLGVQPNYTLETADVYMDVCVRIIEHQRRTYCLKNCELSSISVPNLPSWVPD